MKNTDKSEDRLICLPIKEVTKLLAMMDRAYGTPLTPIALDAVILSKMFLEEKLKPKDQSENTYKGRGVSPCPFCGSNPNIETLGSCIEIYCCASLSRQKSDYLSHEERLTWNQDEAVFSEEVENKVLDIVLSEWNNRI